MSDIVDMLRGKGMYAHSWDECHDTRHAAANEIERLRADLDKYILAVMTEGKKRLTLQAVVDAVGQFAEGEISDTDLTQIYYQATRPLIIIMDKIREE